MRVLVGGGWSRESVELIHGINEGLDVQEEQRERTRTQNAGAEKVKVIGRGCKGPRWRDREAAATQ